jgi:hypothetical protein
VDIDELFDYPYSDVVDLSSFLRYLTGKSYTAVVAQMLDMFSEKPLEGGVESLKDEPLKKQYRFYDISNVRIKHRIKGGRRNNVVESEEIAFYKGGIRKTVFDCDASLTKHPLMFLDGRVKPFEGNAPSHWVNSARVADITGVLFHYKLLDGHFYQQVARRLNKGLDVQKQKKYQEVLDREPSLRIKQETSKECQSVNDLLEDGFLVVSGDYLRWVHAEENKRVLQATTHDEPTALAEALLKSRHQERTKTLKMQRLRQRQLSDRTRIHNLEQKIQGIQASRSQQRKRLKQVEKRLENRRAKTEQLEQKLGSIQASRTWKLMKTLRLR